MHLVSSVQQASACYTGSARATAVNGCADRKYGVLQLRRMSPMRHALPQRRGGGSRQLLSMPTACRASDEGGDKRAPRVVARTLFGTVWGWDDDSGSTDAPNEVRSTALHVVAAASSNTTHYAHDFTCGHRRDSARTQSLCTAADNCLFEWQDEQDAPQGDQGWKRDVTQSAQHSSLLPRS